MKKLWYAIVEKSNQTNVLLTWCGTSNDAWFKAEEMEKELEEKEKAKKLTVLGGWDNGYIIENYFESLNQNNEGGF